MRCPCIHESGYVWVERWPGHVMNSVNCQSTLDPLSLLLCYYRCDLWGYSVLPMNTSPARPYNQLPLLLHLVLKSVMSLSLWITVKANSWPQPDFMKKALVSEYPDPYNDRKNNKSNRVECTRWEISCIQPLLNGGVTLWQPVKPATPPLRGFEVSRSASTLLISRWKIK